MQEIIVGSSETIRNAVI